MGATLFTKPMRGDLRRRVCDTYKGALPGRCDSLTVNKFIITTLCLST